MRLLLCLCIAASFVGCNQQIPNNIYPLSAWGYTLGEATVGGVGDPPYAYLMDIAFKAKPGTESDIRWIGRRSRCQYGDQFRENKAFLWLAPHKDKGNLPADTGEFEDMKTLPDACELTFAISNSGGDFADFDPKGDGVYCVLKGKFSPGPCPAGSLRPK